MVTGTEFKRMITESGPASQNPEAVKKIIFCTGKVYFDIIKARRDLGEQTVYFSMFGSNSTIDISLCLLRHLLNFCFTCVSSCFWNFLGLDDKIAVSTIEQISPFPYDIVKEECEKYSNAELAFVQEEHKNQGAWSYVQPRFQTAVGGYDRRIHYVGREVCPVIK